MMQLMWGALGTLGFGMIFNANKDKLIYIMIGGFLNTLAYILIYKLTNNIFLEASVCALVTSIYSEVMAIIFNCPSTIFILTGLIPSVPGGSLFYTMQNLVLQNNKLALKYAYSTIDVILGMVSGILIYSVISVIMVNIRRKK